jgi:zinc protease
MYYRTIKPETSNIHQIQSLKREKILLQNGLPVYFLNEPGQDLIKIEFIFYAGSYFQNKKLTAVVTANLLQEGTLKKSSREISEIFDYYGVYANFDPQKDLSSISIFVLEKHLEPVLQLVEEIFKEASFPESELETYLQNLKQQHIVSLEKVINVARMQFGKLIFGETHPYGKVLGLEDFDLINRKDIVDFYKNHYSANNAFCIVAGSSSEKITPILEKFFGGNDWINPKGKDIPIITDNFPKPDKHFIPKENAVQSAVRIGKILPGINHTDYHKILITNVLLGGYFGSRLMKNIRQEKGYTYGINSAIVSLLNSTYFFISSQIGVEVCEKALKEIYSEIELLRTVSPDIEEVNIVRNYLYGGFLRSFDGVFAQAERLKELVAFDLDDEHFTSYIKTLDGITPVDIMNTANKHFNENEMAELVVGKK